MLRCFKLLIGIALTLGLCGSAWAAQAEYPYPTPAQFAQPGQICPPKSKTLTTPPFAGYYQPKWRQWPGETRLEVINPAAVNREVLPTPQGQKHIQTPPTAPREVTPSQEGTPSPMMPQEGELLPPSGEILPPEKPMVPKQPSSTLPKPKKQISIPSGTGLPGLPSDPLPNATPKTPEIKLDNKPTPKPPVVEKPQSGIRPENIEQLPTVSAPIERPLQQPNTTVQLVNGQEAVQNREALHQAEPIETAPKTDSSSPNAADEAAYALVESDTSAAASELNGPRVAIGGYCPVELLHNGKWVAGDLRFTVFHNGWMYRLSGPKQWKEFSANPEAFVPANSGNDAVLTIEEHREAPGQVAYCATYNGHLYMFATAETQAKFNKDPQRYVGEKPADAVRNK